MNVVIGSLKSIFDDALIAASTDEPVLILGETGTGKEVLARFIHQNSSRRDRIFIPYTKLAPGNNLHEVFPRFFAPNHLNLPDILF